MTAKAGESTTRFVVWVEQARRVVNALAVSLDYVFVHKLDESVQLLLDNAHVSKRANGRKPMNWHSRDTTKQARVGTAETGAPHH